MISVILAAGLLGGGFRSPILAADGDTNRPIANRVLFLVETSKPMKSRASAARYSVLEFVRSGLSGRLHNSDTFAIWTFNDRLAGQFPVQRWSRAELTWQLSDTDELLKAQKCEKLPDLGPVMPELNRVITNSDRLILITFTSGNSKWEGTPFDADINAIYTRHQADLAKSKVPFITVFLVMYGRIVNYSVNSSAGPVTIPDGPAPGITVEEPKKPDPPVGKVTPTHSPPPVRMLPPLILKGPDKKPAATETIAPPAEEKPAAPPATTEPKAAEPSPAPATPNAESPSTSAPITTESTSVAAGPPTGPALPLNPKDAAMTGVAPAAAPGAGRPFWLWIIGGLMLTGGIAFSAVMIRHARPAPNTSLITQSMEQRRR